MLATCKRLHEVRVAMKQNTIITIERPGCRFLLVEVEGNYHAASFGGRDARGLAESPDEPACFEDIEAKVTSDHADDDSELVIRYKAGEPVKLTSAEERLANEALLKAWKNDI